MQALFLLLLLSSVSLIMPSELQCSNEGIGPCINNNECPPKMTCVESKSGGPVCCEEDAIVKVKNAEGN
ncbi:unnamed protein product [Cylicocyclus nassatus]|uniref:Uncharacterized protein n=1 Tax=Cylicocyclus nassatus TaxID=53992 RepID=A0AA36DJR3_CYLNA|nr:unnamed protein product [Cylicocyclus nassatus]